MRTRWMVGVLLVLGWTTMAAAQDWSWQPADDVRLPSVALAPVRMASAPTTVYHPLTELTPEYRTVTGEVGPYAAAPPANYVPAPANYAAPAANYAMPTANYFPAPVNYAAPANYAAPVANYAAPANFAMPPANYFPAPANYAAPAANYAAPTVYYASPAATYTPVATGYVAAYAPSVGLANVVYRPVATATCPVNYATPVTVAYPAATVGPYPMATMVAYTPAPPPVSKGPRTWVHSKVYVEGQPIRNLLRAITP